MKIANKSRCVWREEQFMLHLLQQAVSPLIGLEGAIQNWYEISNLLRENSRKRELKIEQIEK